MAEDDRDGEVIVNLHQRIAELETRVATMTRHRSEDELNVIALMKAREIEDLFAQSHEGGRGQRLARIQIVVRETVRRALCGETDWRASSDMRTIREPIGG